MPPHYILQIRTEQGRVYEHPLRGTPVSVGRQPDNDVVLDHTSVSGHHLRIEPATPGADAPFVAVDLGSRIGTSLRGQRLPAQTPVPLSPEALLTVGPYTLRIVQCEAQVVGAGAAQPRAAIPEASSSPPPLSSSRRLWMLAGAGFALALISLLINVVLVAKLSRAANVGGEIVTEVGGVVDESLAEGITLDIDIAQTIPVSTSVPIDEVFDVRVQHEVTIDEVIQTEIFIPVANRSVTIDVPIRATIPLDLEVPVHVAKTVQINTNVPIETSVPIHLDTEALGLAPVMEKIQGWLARLQQVF